MGVPHPAPTHQLLANARSIVNSRITWRNSRTHDGMPIGSNPMGVGRVLQILIDGNDRMGKNKQNPKKCKINPPNNPMPNFWATTKQVWLHVLWRITRLGYAGTTDESSDGWKLFLPKKIPRSKISILKKSFHHPLHLKSVVPALWASSVCLQGIKSSSRSVKSIKEIKS